MSKIRLLVDQLRLTPSEAVEKYNQTVPLPLPTYYLLCGLSEHLHISRTRLSGMLLTAALEEAIAALPAEAVNESGANFATQAEYVRYLAWLEQSRQETADEFSGKQERKTTA
jgi:hypothetical protein